MQNQESVEDVFGPVISSYSRAQAIDDGILIDITEHAKQDGFRFPVAVTSALFTKLEPPNGSYESFGGRVHDLLFLLRIAIRKSNQTSMDEVQFTVKLGRENVAVWSKCGPGDDAEPVITIMLRGED